jgi:hypothetical protein
VNAQRAHTLAADPRLSAVGALVEGIGYLLLFLMLFVPAAYQPIKAGLLAVVLGAILARALVEGRIALHPKVAFGCLLFSLLGVIFILRGYVASAPGALRMATVYVLWPWVYTVLLTGLAGEARLWRVARIMVWSAVAVCLYCISYLLWSAGLLPNSLYIPLDQGQRIGFYEGTVEFSVKSIGSLIFLVPFATAALLAWPRRAPLGRGWLWLVLLMGFPLGLLSGRRAFQLILVLAVPIALAFRQLLPPAMRAAERPRFRRVVIGGTIACVLAVAMLGATYGLRLDAVWDTFKTGFAFTVDPVAQVRAKQFSALIDGWLASPLLGSGHGAPAPEVIRSTEMPWAYELAYLAFLYHTGLIGFLFHAVGILWIYRWGVRIIREGTSISPLMVAVLTGMTAFLIANATNPYLERYDYLWVIFLPIAFVNLSLLAKDCAALPATA